MARESSKYPVPSGQQSEYPLPDPQPVCADWVSAFCCFGAGRDNKVSNCDLSNIEDQSSSVTYRQVFYCDAEVDCSGMAG